MTSVRSSGRRATVATATVGVVAAATLVAWPPQAAPAAAKDVSAAAVSTRSGETARERIDRHLIGTNPRSAGPAGHPAPRRARAAPPTKTDRCRSGRAPRRDALAPR